MRLNCHLSEEPCGKGAGAGELASGDFDVDASADPAASSTRALADVASVVVSAFVSAFDSDWLADELICDSFAAGVVSCSLAVIVSVTCGLAGTSPVRGAFEVCPCAAAQLNTNADRARSETRRLLEICVVIVVLSSLGLDGLWGSLGPLTLLACATPTNRSS